MNSTTIGMAILKTALSWLLKPAVFAKIQAGIILLFSVDKPGKEKRELVKEWAQEAHTALTEGKKVLSDDVLDFSVRAAYMILAKKPIELDAEAHDG